MSYEGYTQNICENGHYFICDAYDPCSCDCGKEAAWTNAVNETNCMGEGVIHLDVLDKNFLLAGAVYETCNLGHSHLVQQSVYRIPTNVETDPLRSFMDWNEHYKSLKKGL